MPLKKHHKIIIGSFSSFLIVLLIGNSFFIYILYGQLNLSYNKVEKNLIELKEDTQSKLNELTENILQTKSELNLINAEIGSIDKQFAELKASASSDFSGIIENSIKAVVTIRTNVGQGTGFVISSEGYVVTNAHVLSGSRIIQVVDYQHNTLPAEFVGYDSEFDIALLKISEVNEIIELENSNKVQVGEKVIAIGNPLGLQFSVSEGIVSAIHREGPNEISAYIQTDAALNPGNSGGPLINKKGKVIGINNFKVGGGESLGFALESNYIKEIVNEIAQNKLNQTLV
jgi:S1-C subfamily serine protease